MCYTRQRAIETRPVLTETFFVVEMHANELKVGFRLGRQKHTLLEVKVRARVVSLSHKKTRILYK